MFREMRRKNQQLTDKECTEILKNATSGVLALSGDGGYPYAVPLSYVYDGAKIYFHCAKSGHKIDAINRDAKASFCVIAQDVVVPEKYTTRYKSVILFGKIRILEKEDEKHAAIEKLAVKYASDNTQDDIEQEVERYKSALCMLELTPDYISGKEAIEITKERNQLK